ncbi:MAG: DUF7948 domain-containing protein, partial [Gammaproteobacteria bacterium]
MRRETGKGRFALLLITLALVLPTCLLGARLIQVPSRVAMDSGSPAGKTNSTSSALLPGLAAGFEQNIGQAANSVAFVSRPPGYTLYLATDQVVLELSGSPSEAVVGNPGNLFRMRFAGAENKIELEARDVLPGRIHYLHGVSDPLHNIPRYQKVLAKGVYPGIDVLYYT